MSFFVLKIATDILCHHIADTSPSSASVAYSCKIWYTLCARCVRWLFIGFSLLEQREYLVLSRLDAGDVLLGSHSLIDVVKTFIVSCFEIVDICLRRHGLLDSIEAFPDISHVESEASNLAAYLSQIKRMALGE